MVEWILLENNEALNSHYDGHVKIIILIVEYIIA